MSHRSLSCDELCCSLTHQVDTTRLPSIKEGDSLYIVLYFCIVDFQFASLVWWYKLQVFDFSWSLWSWEHNYRHDAASRARRGACWWLVTWEGNTVIISHVFTTSLLRVAGANDVKALVLASRSTGLWSVKEFYIISHCSADLQEDDWGSRTTLSPSIQAHGILFEIMEDHSSSSIAILMKDNSLAL